jgi:hypothetical protein
VLSTGVNFNVTTIEKALLAGGFSLLLADIMCNIIPRCGKVPCLEDLKHYRSDHIRQLEALYTAAGCDSQ